MTDEREILAWLKPRLVTGPDVVVGMGDDAAVVNPAGRGALVTACDQVIEGVHFEADTEPALIGRKALARNLSDLAAMGARPWLALAAVAWPESHATEALKRMFEGLLACARDHDTRLIGGDLGCSPEGIRVDVTVIGCMEGRRPLLRTGAQVGDDLVVTGTLGGSREGHHLTFEPRWREGILLAECAEVHAGLDVSDGLALDLARLLAADRLGARIEAAAVPRRRLNGGELAGLDSALHDGEDHELLLAVAPGALARLNEHPLLAALPLTRIGQVTDGDCELMQPDGRVTPLAVEGYEHRFASSLASHDSMDSPDSLELTTESPDRTEALAERLGRALKGGELLVLTGELGAGKTVFVRGLLRGLGGRPGAVRSPSYTLHHRHPGRLTLNHFDVYFTDTAEDLERADLAALLASGEVVAMEWGERFEQDLPPGALRIELLHTGDPEHRRLRFSARDPAGRRLLAALGAPD